MAKAQGRQGSQIRAAQAGPAAESTSIAPPLDELQQAVLALETQKGEVARLARAAREAGATWTAIGRATGVSPQAAYQRWSIGGNRKHRDNQRARRQSN